MLMATTAMERARQSTKYKIKIQNYKTLLVRSMPVIMLTLVLCRETKSQNEIII